MSWNSGDSRRRRHRAVRTYNKTQPYNTATFRPQTEQFVTSFGRPQAFATTLGSVLYPDMLVVDATKNPSTASDSAYQRGAQAHLAKARTMRGE